MYVQICLSIHHVKNTCIILSLELFEIVYEHVFLLLKIVQEFNYIVTWQLYVYDYENAKLFSRLAVPFYILSSSVLARKTIIFPYLNCFFKNPAGGF